MYVAKQPTLHLALSEILFYKFFTLKLLLTRVIMAVAKASAQRAARRNMKNKVAQQPILINRKLGPLTTSPGFGGGLSM